MTYELFQTFEDLVEVASLDKGANLCGDYILN